MLISSSLPPLLQPLCYSAHTLVSQGYDASVARRLWTVTSNQLWWSPCFCTDMQLWQGSASDCLFRNRPETCGSICSVGRRGAGSWEPCRTVIQYLLVGGEHGDAPSWCFVPMSLSFLTVFSSQIVLVHTHTRRAKQSHKRTIMQPKCTNTIRQHMVPVNAFLWVVVK